MIIRGLTILVRKVDRGRRPVSLINGGAMKLEPFRLERYFAQYEFKARYLLCSSDCETMSVDEILSLEPEARHRLASLRLGYTEPPGSPSLRQAIASMYGAIGPEEVVVHSGAEEAIFLFMHAVLRPGGSRWWVHSSLLPVAGGGGTGHRGAGIAMEGKTRGSVAGHRELEAPSYCAPRRWW